MTLAALHERIGRDLKSGIVVEVGVGEGRNLANLIANVPPEVRVVGADPWIDLTMEDCIERMKVESPHIFGRCVLIREPLWRSARYFKDDTVDVVIFTLAIARERDPAFRQARIDSWAPKLKTGGLFAYEYVDHIFEWRKP